MTKTKKQQLLIIEKIKKENIIGFLKHCPTLKDTFKFFQIILKSSNYFEKLPLEILHIIYYYSLCQNVIKLNEIKWENIMIKSIKKNEEFVLKWLLTLIQSSNNSPFGFPINNNVQVHSKDIAMALAEKKSIPFIILCHRYNVVVDEIFIDQYFKNFQLNCLIRKNIGLV